MDTAITGTPVIAKGASMRILDILVAPRYAIARSTQWIIAVLYILATGAGIAFARVAPDPHAEFIAVMFYAFAVGILWWGWLARLLLVARDGRRLVLAQVVRASALAACSYALLSVGVPALLAWVNAGNVAIAVLYPALAVVTCVAWLLLPRWLAMWFGFVPAIYIGLHNAHFVPSPVDPRFQHWAWLALMVLVVVDVVRWRQMLHGDDDDGSWHSTMLLQFARMKTGCSLWSIERDWAWRRPSGKKTAVDFRGIKPADPARAIRVVLGGWYVPQTVQARVATAARVVLPLLLFIPVVLLIDVSRADAMWKVWKIIGISGGLWIGLLGAAMLALGIAAMLQRRWRSGADMAVLALLPGLGGVRANEHLLRAACRGPIVAFVVLWLCMLVGIVLTVASPVAVLLATLFVVEMAALMAMASLRTMAGMRMRLAMKIALGVVLIVLTDTGFTLAFTESSAQWAAASVFTWLTTLAWFGLVCWTAWSTSRAWRALQRRPHPFLANTP